MYVLSFSDFSDSDSLICSDVLEMERISSGLSDFQQQQPMGYLYVLVCSSLLYVLKGSRSISGVTLIFFLKQSFLHGLWCCSNMFSLKLCQFLENEFFSLFIVEGFSYKVVMGSGSESYHKWLNFQCHSVWKYYSLSFTSVFLDVLSLSSSAPAHTLDSFTGDLPPSLLNRCPQCFLTI